MFFFGHGEINITEELCKKTKILIEDLIINKNARNFLFGSRSKFNDLCHVVDELKRKYPQIKRIAYTCKSEGCIFESEREKWKKIYTNCQLTSSQLLYVDEEVEHKTKYVSGKASYIERNQSMIDNSDYCVFYYDSTYSPQIKKTFPKQLYIVSGK